MPEEGELLVADDCSTSDFARTANKEISTWPHCKVWQSPSNIGRAAIRNRLAEMAEGEVLIFIDCDARVDNEKFINTYLQEIQQHDVVCGGTGNLRECPSPDVILRWKYETKAEKRLTIEQRRMHPYAQFTTFNFAIKRDTFLKILFNEKCTQYGHEDTIFGRELKRRDIGIWHIENKLTHLGLENATEYIKKTETALRSAKNMNDEEKQYIRVAKLSSKLENLHLVWLIRFIFRILGTKAKKHLEGKNPSLTILNLYKLGYYNSIG